MGPTNRCSTGLRHPEARTGPVASGAAIKILLVGSRIFECLKFGQQVDAQLRLVDVERLEFPVGG